jgi:NDP-sugar pyrophosphorylase family protein
MEAFILAAGLGTRLKPITDSIPKALVKINGISLLEILLKRLVKFSVDRIVINVHHFGDQIIDFLQANNNFGVNLSISDERRLLLDTGGGLKKAFKLLQEDNFIIHNVDILTNLDISSFMNFHIDNGHIATLAVQKRESSRYFLFDDRKLLCGWENVITGEKIISRNSTGTLSRYAFSGIHAGSRDLHQLMPDKEVFSMVDFYLSIAKTHQITYFNHSDTAFIDIGKKENLPVAESIISLL